jgi:hypothetical protein
MLHSVPLDEGDLSSDGVAMGYIQRETGINQNWCLIYNKILPCCYLLLNQIICTDAINAPIAIIDYFDARRSTTRAEYIVQGAYFLHDPFCPSVCLSGYLSRPGIEPNTDEVDTCSFHSITARDRNF